MKTLIVPMAGKSSRFPNMRPKWMLTHPKKNRFMVNESISGLNLDFFDKIYFVVLQEHEDKYQFSAGLVRELDEMGIREKSNIAYLTEQTSSQSETVYQVIQGEEIEGFVLNRLQGALLNEAVRLHEEGYASMEDIDISLKHALGIRWAFLGPFEIMDLNAPGGIKDSFTRYRPGIKKLAEQQNSVPDYSDDYILKLEKEQRLRLKSSDRDNRIKKRNQLIALVRKLKLENGE